MRAICTGCLGSIMSGQSSLVSGEEGSIGYLKGVNTRLLNLSLFNHYFSEPDTSRVWSGVNERDFHAVENKSTYRKESWKPEQCSVSALITLM